MAVPEQTASASAPAAAKIHRRSPDDRYAATLARAQMAHKRNANVAVNIAQRDSLTDAKVTPIPCSKINHSAAIRISGVMAFTR